MTRPPLHLLAAAVLCAAALALTSACGGGAEKKESVDPAQAAKSAYATAVNKICKEQVSRIQDSVKDVKSTSTTAEQRAAFVKIGDGFLTEVELVRAVHPPTALAADVDAWLASLTAAAKLVQEQGLSLVKQGKAPFADSDAKATGLGLKDCAFS